MNRSRPMIRLILVRAPVSTEPTTVTAPRAVRHDEHHRPTRPRYKQPVQLGAVVGPGTWGEGIPRRPPRQQDMPRAARARARSEHPLTCTDRGKVAAYAFTKKATNKVDTITAWWTGGLYNVGVYMSGSGLIVIDEDLLDARAKYAADHGKEIPITFTVSTAKGRHHYFYDTENGTFGNHEGALAEYGINVRSGNAYVVGPGSMHVSGTVYEVEILAPIVPLPTWIRDAIRAKPNGHKDEPADSSNGFNGFELPKVIRGDRPDRPGERDNVLFAFASSLRAQSINYATAKLMMEMAWSRCEQPPIAHTAFTWDKA